MLILILIKVQYLQNVVFIFEKNLNDQNHSSDFHHPIKNPPQQNSLMEGIPPPINTMWKTLVIGIQQYESSLKSISNYLSINI